LKRHQVTKCPGSWLGASFVSVPSLRRRSVGPPPSAIHGGGRLSRHPCRSTHSTSPAFSLHPSRDLWRLGYCALRSKIKSERQRRSSILTQFLWETPEVTTAAIAVRHLADEPSDPPLRCCRTTSAAPTGFRVQLEIWIRHVIAARLIGLWLTPDLFRLRRVT
jgi:hypothetical protein